MALQRLKYPDPKRMEGAIRRGIQWLLMHAKSRWRLGGVFDRGQ